ncbi:MAG: aminopeptidase, partial [Alphaproteobacteria bacterium]|nr:aminopeptidase [Alphaproteobacteria bacterium]
RMGRAGDHSFWGIGVPSPFMGMGEQPAGAADNVMGAVLGGGTRKSAGFDWWWHAPDDTLDKMDPELLVRDTRVYVHATWRLLTDHVLPLDYEAASAALMRELMALTDQVAEMLDLSLLLQRTRQLGTLALALTKATDTAAADRACIAVSRALVPMDYTRGDRFDHDPALSQSPYPVLDPVRRLAESQSSSDLQHFRLVAARRACNGLGFALAEANAARTDDIA